MTGKASTQCSAENTPLAANANNQLSSYTYDVAGNLIGIGGGTATYDAESELAAAGGYTYLYDGDGNRVEKPTVPRERCTGTAVRASCSKPTYWGIRSPSTYSSVDSAWRGAT